MGLLESQGSTEELNVYCRLNGRTQPSYYHFARTKCFRFMTTAVHNFPLSYFSFCILSKSMKKKNHTTVYNEALEQRQRAVYWFYHRRQEMKLGFLKSHQGSKEQLSRCSKNFIYLLKLSVFFSSRWLPPEYTTSTHHRRIHLKASLTIDVIQVWNY